MRRGVIFAAFLVSLAGCGKQPPTVIVDGWWNTDYAKDVCRQAKDWSQKNTTLMLQVGCDDVCKEMTNRADACFLDDAGGVGDYQNRLITEMSASSECRGVQIVQMNSPTGSDKSVNNASRNKAHWTLMFDFIPGKDKQDWSLVRSGRVLKGVGGLAESARKICTIVSERGGIAAN